jgi:hypothetical protein
MNSLRIKDKSSKQSHDFTTKKFGLAAAVKLIHQYYPSVANRNLCTSVLAYPEFEGVKNAS